MKNKNFFKYISFIVIILLFIPLGTQYLINFDTNAKGSDDGWLGFWGGYLGSIIGVIGAIIILQIQLSRETETREKEQKNVEKTRQDEIIDNTFFNLLDLHITQQDKLLSKNIFEKILESTEKELKETLHKEGVSYFYSKKEEIISILSLLNDDYINYMAQEEKKLLPESIFFKRWTRHKQRKKIDSYNYSPDEQGKIYDHLTNALKASHDTEDFIKDITDENLSTFRDSMFNLDIISLLEKMIHYSKWQGSEAVQHSLTEFHNDLIRYNDSNFNFLLSQDGRANSVETALEEFYPYIGSYLKILHRIVKYVNDNTENVLSRREEYIDFLRATLNESEILVIYYTCVYSSIGSDLLHQLKSTNFFGTTDVPVFVNKNKVYFKEDIKNMEDMSRVAHITNKKCGVTD